MRTSTTGKGGFTLVELLVVIVLMTVLSTMALPRLAGASGAAQLRTAAGQLLTTGRYARDYATTHRSICRLALDGKEGRYKLLCQSDPQNKPDEFSPLRWGIGKEAGLAEPIRFEQIRIEPRKRADELAPRRGQYIQFDPGGQADAAALILSDGRQAYSLLVAPHTGRVWLEDGRARQLPNDRQDLDE